jgi:DNA-binding SARP family transcriptional activator
MLRLTTFGVPQVHRDGEPLGGPASQRRVLGLLSLLAVAGTRGVSRDTILGILWSDADAMKARQALTQSLYHIRRALQQEDLIEAAGELRLNAAAISSDVAEFEDALSKGDFERAVDLHKAPFLDGFYVSGAPEFERWTTETRARLLQRCGDAYEKLGTAEEARLNSGVAVQWWKRLAALEPLNSRIAMRLMTALAAAGDRAGAIQYARVHEMLLREELDVAPDLAFSALVEQLQRDTSWIPLITAPANGGELLDNTSAGEQSMEKPSAEPRTPEHGEPLSVSAASQRDWLSFQRLRSHPQTRLGAGIAIVLLLLAMVATQFEWPRSQVPARQDLVVVAPFRISGADPSLSYLREGLVDLLVTKLTDDASTRAADAGAVMNAWRRAGLSDVVDVPRADALRLARRLGANRLIVGSIVGNPLRLVISATVITIDDGELRAQASVEGRPEDLTTLVDELVTRLLAKEAGAWDRLVNRTSTSSQALRAYLDGQAAYRRGRYRDAIGAFRRALEIDSSFAMAGLGLASAADRINATADRARGLAVAWAAQTELIDRDRVFLTALVGPRYPAPSSERESLLAWERASASVTDRADVWHELGERLFFDGQLLGIADWASRSATAFRRAVDLDPLFASPWRYLVHLAATDGDTLALQQSASQYLQLDSIGDLSGFVRWRSAAGLSDGAQAGEVERHMAAMPAASLRAIAVSAQYHGIRLGDADRALGVLRSRAVGGAERRDADLALYALAMNRGQPARAARVLGDLERPRAGVEGNREEHLLVLGALYGGGDSAEAARAVMRLERRASDAARATGILDRLPIPASGKDEDACVTAQWSAWRSSPPADTKRAVRLSALGATGENIPACAALVDAITATRSAGSNARRSIERVDSIVSHGPPLGSMRAYVNLALAQLYTIVGDSVTARTVVRRRPHMEEWPYYLAAQLLLEARLADAGGDTNLAVQSYRHYLRLRESPEAEIRREVQEVETAMARLLGKP